MDQEMVQKVDAAAPEWAGVTEITLKAKTIHFMGPRGQEPEDLVHTEAPMLVRILMKDKALENAWAQGMVRATDPEMMTATLVQEEAWAQEADLGMVLMTVLLAWEPIRATGRVLVQTGEAMVQVQEAMLLMRN